MTPETRLGRVSFVGAGPGAADLITLRGARHIAEADIVVWAASLVTPECVQEHARADAELVDSSRLTHEDSVEIYRRAERERLKVARVHSGDPALWGAVQEQHDVCARMELEVEIVPGVAAFSAAAAAVGRELTVPEVAQSVVLTRLEGGKTPMPSGERVREFAKHGTTMALFLSAARTGQLVEELRAGGYGEDVPVVIAYKTTWPDELLLRTTLGELETTVKQHKLWRHTLFLVGWALTEGGTRSHLYNPGHFHTFRRADPAARRALRAQRGDSAQNTARPQPKGSTRPRPEGGSGARSAPEGSASQSGSTAAGSTAAGSAVAGDTAVGTAGAGPETTEPVPEPRAEDVRRPGQPDPDVAWWAVRDWQQSARGAARVAASRTASRRDGDAATQPQLFVETEGDDHGRSGDAPTAVAGEPSTGAETESAGETAAQEDRAVSEDSAGVQTVAADAVERAAAAEPESSGTASTVGSSGTQRAGAKAAPKSRAKSGSTGKPSGSGGKSKTKNGSAGNAGKSKPAADKPASGQARDRAEQD